MAKKGNRPNFHLRCTVCKEINYISNRSVVNTPEKIEINKFCKRCRKHTLHKELKISKAKK
ncbi:50S ribosomal protein L33 [Candidatus Berkelbacteria bacterium CG_4_9_14_3_um_filter_39_23]|uniref:Large ribosomal subunit protein bL33 n=2 Tax=Candidatus Berkelbacteria TaxID=1618330 RepID=A0A2M7CHP6_9BACT|nr:50S ribosomal protein L33 [Candidatus Berkelbacteria bacterium]OIP05072.1 MAG: 50S ribosomal protein L33 [Candidatus Berkelbacteria bacterium CG2_30_39_44]PIR28195.1 MAG: 50S ribosomal protein L33 [Candidatus Berkelbacteria bacterium CG11_big_fil_rev_8_21_14_0_20_40_23]PIV25128.1 MAG: 50S ribosomal protein L33 [Candidatus Berkelbacteria bacterium CG03_land_8_20_14_0_80_40_36]PIX30885.1 MAG: 50S ribosomal protein L33 [Candidatus Berkelbacteria bacterium CG_4_8_14_3_um_filter_39_27]PIZ28663.1